MKILFAAFILFTCGSLSAQNVDAVITPSAVENIEKNLSSDAMRGRATFTPDIDKAAAYIATQFKAAGLHTWNGSASYLQPFAMVQAKTLSASASLDGISIPAASIAVASSSAHLVVDENSGYEKVFIKAGGSFRDILKYLSQEKKSYLVLIDTSFSKNFPRLAGFAAQQFKSPRSVVMILTAADPARYSITVEQEVSEKKLANVVGILPGKSKKNEYVIFSGHYDHLGVGQPNEKGDSVFNGANDDASGSTAVIMLAKYFGKLNNNERTLIFATFTAEEIGGFGSQYFSHQFDPAAVMAMFNIEMIGTESKWGTNSAYITGYEKTDMGKILEKNLSGSKFSFYPDPYTEQQLFYRSDNATLARQGVPAHTISTSKMDSEKFYHTQGDELSTLDMKNMAEIIKSIALSAKTIIAGTDTPSRVDATQLR
ncbi:M28 family peptidase [Flavitalea sp. BT771]|uniref:M28 family metallopeptidase n=1 Tax=Flavitalea sp. BT771 TaxID=3063329 RepID=UPI0026E33F41|nr:M28 family peptidase [Flavitalea sp. BT771]MDO6433831.1 M28 family peptidase [Flavitalea sp. BT771]MDV6222264.1 M28 family peptidase [Flavitalea sp. BT771]